MHHVYIEQLFSLRLNRSFAKMFRMILICILAASKHVVSHNQDLPAEQTSPEYRYMELRKQVYGLTLVPSQNFGHFMSLLLEMYSIERDKTFESRFKHYAQLNGYQFNDYKIWVDAFRRAGFLLQSEASMTKLLLQTFDFQSNECSEEYFGLLGQLQHAFENMAIYPALQENRRQQYRNCWDRLMNILGPANMLVGVKVGQHLDKLSSEICPNTRSILLQLTDQSQEKYRKDSLRYSRKIMQFLMSLKITHSFELNLEQLILKPCKLLVNKTYSIMLDVKRILKSNTDEDFISSENVQILNRFILCERILADSEFISSTVLKVMIAEIKTRQLDPQVDLSLEANEENLITRYENIGTILNQQAAQVNPPQSTESSTKRRRIKKSQEVLIDREFVPDDVIVVEIKRSVGAGRNTRYPTIWSDGRITKETKDYLVTHWQDAYDRQYHKQRAENQMRYLRRKGIKQVQESSDQVERRIGLNDQGHNNSQPVPDMSRFVTRIEEGVGYYPNIKYPTVWSNGDVTMESSEFLMKNWKDAWLQMTRRNKSTRFAKWLRVQRETKD